MRGFTRLLTVALSLFVVRTASAQTIVGRVVLAADSSMPLQGAIVIASNQQGVDVARGLTSATGRFDLRLALPGPYRVRVLRIGFRPVRSDWIEVPRGSTPPVRILFAEEPITLAPVRVRDRETCRVDADTGFAVARVWDEARKAMLSSQLTGGDTPLFAEWIEYDRSFDSTGHIVREQRVRTEQHPTTHAFKSRPVAELMARGYVIDEGALTTYYAPDVDVLLSDAFASSHCFHLEPAPRGRDALIGVGFQPVRGRRDARDIVGTLWVDRSTSELTSLEFKYTNLPPVAEMAGGEVHFRRIADGSWLVSRWSVRMPQVVTVRRRPDPTRTVVQSTSTATLRGMQVTGGEVIRVTRHDSLVYRATGPHVVVVALSSDTLVRRAGATLTLDGTDYKGTADSTGLIRLDPVLAGTYRARLSTPLMDSLGLPPRAAVVETHENAHVDSLMLPLARDLLAAACPRETIRNGEGMLYGRLRDERARAVEGAAVTVTWRRDIGTDIRDAPRMSSAEQTLGALTGGQGYWRVCGVPRGRAIAVRAATDSSSDLRRVLLAPDEAYAAVDLIARAQLQQAESVSTPDVRRLRSALEVAVITSDGHPLSDVTLEVVSRERTLTVVTDSMGRALLPDVAPGQLTVRARRIGYRRGQLIVTAEPGRNTIPIILDPTQLPTLDTVRVVGDRRVVGLARHDEFETRHLNRLAAASFSRAEIQKRNPVDIWQLLMGVPSIRIVDSAGVTAESARSFRPTPNLSLEKCYLLILVDGMAMNAAPGQKAFDLRLLPKPDEVYGVEVFAGPSSIPLKYLRAGDGSWCGAIAVWTR